VVCPKGMLFILFWCDSVLECAMTGVRVADFLGGSRYLLIRCTQ
jgi:hypothetical protein